MDTEYLNDNTSLCPSVTLYTEDLLPLHAQESTVRLWVLLCLEIRGIRCSEARIGNTVQSPDKGSLHKGICSIRPLYRY